MFVMMQIVGSKILFFHNKWLVIISDIFHVIALL